MLQSDSQNPTIDFPAGSKREPLYYRIVILIGLGGLAFFALPLWICLTFVTLGAIGIASDALAYKTHSNLLSAPLILLSIGFYPFILTTALQSLGFFGAITVGLAFLAGAIAMMLESYAVFGSE